MSALQNKLELRTRVTVMDGMIGFFETSPRSKNAETHRLSMSKGKGPTNIPPLATSNLHNQTSRGSQKGSLSRRPHNIPID